MIDLPPASGLAAARALRSVLTRCLRPDALRAMGARPSTVFHGWPGALFLVDRIEAAGGDVGPLAPLAREAAAALMERGGGASEAPAPGAPSSFFFGERGRRWALAAAAGARAWDFEPPAAQGPPDPFAQDAPVYFAFLGAAAALEPAHRGRLSAAWGGWIRGGWEALRAARARGDAIPLGFAHGAAGILYMVLRGLGPGADPQVEAALRADLGWLADQAVGEGDAAWWPSRLGEGVEPRSPFSGGICNGSLGHALLFLEAGVRFEDDALLEVAAAALGGASDEDALPLGFCCGHAGKAAVVSRFHRLGQGHRLGDAAGSWARLLTFVAEHGDEMENLSAVSGLMSCLPAILAQGPASPVMDHYLPAVG